MSETEEKDETSEGSPKKKDRAALVMGLIMAALLGLTVLAQLLGE